MDVDKMMRRCAEQENRAAERGREALSDWLKKNQMKVGMRVQVGDEKRWGTVIEASDGTLGVTLDPLPGPNRKVRRAAMLKQKSDDRRAARAAARGGNRGVLST